MLGDLILEAFDLLDRSNTLYSAYRAAWRTRQRSGDDRLDVLVYEMQRRSVAGAYDEPDSPRIAPAVRAWMNGVPPRAARKDVRRAPARRD